MELWNAIYVASRSELKVQERLNQKNIITYVPVQKVMKQWSDRKKRITEPLLRGYVFLHIDPKKRVEVLETQGVVAFVKNFGKDAVISNTEIEVLKTIESHGYETAICSQTFAIGDTIKINQGSFNGFKAKIINVTKDGTLYAFLLEGIGQCVRVKVPKDIAEKS